MQECGRCARARHWKDRGGELCGHTQHSIAGQHGVVALEQASGALVLAYGQLAAASETHLIAIRDDGLNATVGWTTPLAASAMGVVADPR